MKFNDPERIRSYVYRCRDQSILSPLLRRYVCQPLLTVIPKSWAPNLITLLGHVSILIGFIWIAVFTQGGPMASLGPVTFLISAVSIAIYILADIIDGLQARRLGVSGPLGDYIEHALDTSAGFLVPLGALMAYGADMGFGTMLVLGCGMAWWTTTAERLTTGELRLPPFSDIESHALFMTIHLVAAVAGPDFWRLPFLAVPAIDAAVLFGIAVSAVISSIAIFKVGPAITSLAGLGASWLPYMIWYLTLRAKDLELAASPLPAFIFGMIAARHVEEMLRRCILGTKPLLLDWPIILTGIALIASLLPPLAHDASLQLAAMIAATVAVTLYTIGQFVIAARFLASTLNIRLFSLPAHAG